MSGSEHAYPPGWLEKHPLPVMGSERIDYEVSHGYWEELPEAPIGACFYRHLWPLRRKRFETWRDEHGNKWGRWDWDVT